jgi:2-dehydropantoate 2-reductase
MPPEAAAPVTVIGGGGIGGPVAAALALAGETVTIVDKLPEHVDEIRRSGLRCDGVHGDRVARIERALLWEELAEPVDIAILAVKSRDTPDAIAALRPLLSEHSVVVSLQNGWNPDRIAAALGVERTIPAMVHMVGKYNGPGYVTQHSHGDLYLGEFSGPVTARVHDLARRLSAVTPAHATGNVWGYIWSKQIYGATMPTHALVDELASDIVKLDWVKTILLALILEGISVADAEGISLEPYERFEPAVMRVRDEAGLPAALEGLPKGSAKGHSGVWQDIKRGRPTEVEYLSGELVRIGRSHGLPMTVNAEVVRMVGEIERGRREMSFDNLRLLEKPAGEVVVRALSGDGAGTAAVAARRPHGAKTTAMDEA